MSDEKKIFTITQNVRTFSRVGEGSLLRRTGAYLTSGDSVLIGEPVVMVYDHQDHLAFPIEYQGDSYFLLQEHLQLPEYAQQALELKLKSTCAASDAQVSLRDLFRMGAQRALEAKRKKQNVEPKVVGVCILCGGDVVERHAMAPIPIASMRMGESNPTVTITSCSVCKIVYDGPPPVMPERREFFEQLRRFDEYLVASTRRQKEGLADEEEHCHIVVITNLPDGWTGSDEDMIGVVLRENTEQDIHHVVGTRDEVSRRLKEMFDKMFPEGEETS